MKAGSFSRSVMVREWPARHCFVSLPRPWASVILPAPTPTFSLEVSDERSLLLSWAGDTHNPSPGEENNVLVSRDILRGPGIIDGELGLLTQVPVPPVCSSVTVLIGSLSEWQDLALNVEVAQSAFLSQVRVLSIGQTLPLWLEGGVRVTLTVTNINPPCSYGMLQPMTQVEILPPMEHSDSDGFCPINFTSPVSGSQNNSISSQELSDSKEYYKLEKKNFEMARKFDKNIILPLMNYMTSKLLEQRVVIDSHPKKNIRNGYRVLPLPVPDISQQCELFRSHPSLVILSKESLTDTDLQEEVSFIASIRKIESPKDKAEKALSSREDNKVSESKQQPSQVESKEKQVINSSLCIVMIWENFVKGKGHNSFFDDVNILMNPNSCLITDGLRRLMRLGKFSIIELCNIDVNFRTQPLSIDVSPLMETDNSLGRTICDNIKSMLVDTASEIDVILNKNSLFVDYIDGKAIDVLVRVRDEMPLKITRESVVLVEVTLVSKPYCVPNIIANVADLDAYVTSEFIYVGSESVKICLQRHILLGSGHLVKQCREVPQFALLHGSKGSGKTSLVETLAQNLSAFPYYLHFQIVRCKKLKGKKMETVEKRLQLVFREAIFRKPSVIVLEDLDTLVPSKGIDDQEAGQLHDHTMQMANMLKGLLESLLEFCHSDGNACFSDNPKRGTVMVLATAVIRTSVHSVLVNPQGCHYFPCSFAIPLLEPEERVEALKSMTKLHLRNSLIPQKLMAQKCCEIISQKENYSSMFGANIDIDTNLAMKMTESFVLPDLSHLAYRTCLCAQQRRINEFAESRCCITCGNIVHENIQGDSNAGVNSDIETDTQNKNKNFILSCDLEAAREGYIPLSLRGLDLSDKKGSHTIRVGGLKEARRTLKETLTWPSTYPDLFSKVKLRLRSGVLLYGPPGCGKTLLANSVSVYCHLNFISVKGPELLSKYIGASEEAVRDAFERASSAKPCVLFFDEFESIAPRRGHDSTGVTDRVVNQLLTQMDGVEGLSGVYILAATSRPDLIDPALLRPGRLDKCVYCPMPELEEREDILRILSEDIKLGEEIDWALVASATEHFSGADLQSLLGTAQILVAQEALGKTLYEGVIPSDQIETHTNNVSPETAGIKSQGETDSDNKITLDDTSLKTPDGKYCSFEDTHVMEDYEVQVFNVHQKHIEAALLEVKPSVSSAEREKYKLLYASFKNSRDGNFGKLIPGKRATLA